MGQNKLLLNIKGKTMIRRVVEEARKAEIDYLIVVLGHDFEMVERELRGIQCKTVLNEDYEKGQSFSVICGLKHVPESTDAVLILPGDVAAITTELINRVVAGYRRTSKPIVVLSYQKRGGHPILLRKVLFPEILSITEAGRGLKEITNKHLSETFFVEVDTPAVLWDIDVPADVSRVANLIKS